MNSASGGSAEADLAGQPGVLGVGAERRHDQPEPGPEVMLLRHERRGRGVSPEDQSAPMALRSMVRPSSPTAAPAKLCAPPRTDISRPASWANRTAAATSPGPAQRAITAGWEGEQVFGLRPLPLPPPDAGGPASDAVCLFVERAATSR